MWAEVHLEQQPLGGWIPVWVKHIPIPHECFADFLGWWKACVLGTAVLLVFLWSAPVLGASPGTQAMASQTQQCRAFVLLQLIRVGHNY